MTTTTPGRVALESTLISHGLPWPDNLETALASEAAVRDGGAKPMTIGVIGGTIRLGLSSVEIEHLSHAAAGTVLKASRRDLALAVSRGLDAATTVSATLWLARIHGVMVMATGGLGGVHRGAATTFDISTDLDELARADRAVVVCSGVKSILDIPATLERLETSGVTVVGYGTDDFPAFTTVSSGLRIEALVETPEEAADLIRTHRRLRLPGAILLVQPPPADLAIPREEAEAAIIDALRHSEIGGITGKALTPFLLDAVNRATGGRSLIVNKALIVQNARLAGRVATALASGH